MTYYCKLHGLWLGVDEMVTARTWSLVRTGCNTLNTRKVPRRCYICPGDKGVTETVRATRISHA